MKQDWAEKAVMVEQAKHHRALYCVEIIALLHAERARARRIVRAYKDYRMNQDVRDACDEILARLA